MNTELVMVDAQVQTGEISTSGGSPTRISLQKKFTDPSAYAGKLTSPPPTAAEANKVKINQLLSTVRNLSKVLQGVGPNENGSHHVLDNTSNGPGRASKACSDKNMINIT